MWLFLISEMHHPVALLKNDCCLAQRRIYPDDLLSFTQGDFQWVISSFDTI